MAAGGIIGAVIGGILGGAGSIASIRSEQKSMRKAYLQQMGILMKNYNYNQNALTTEERYALDSAKSRLYSIELNAIQNNAQVSAALSETGTEGRTSRQISRAIEGQTERRKTSVIDNYIQDIGEIRQQKDALYMQVKDTVEQAEDNYNASQASDFQNVMSVFQGSVDGSIKGFMIGSGIGGGFSSMMGGASSGISGVGSGSISAADVVSNVGSIGASSSNSLTLSAGSSGGFSFSNFLGGFNKTYSQYENMFNAFSSLNNMFGSSGRGYNRRYYSFAY